MPNEEHPPIHYLFEPRGIAIIGASADKEKIGHKIVENIMSSGYPGDVYPINPRGGEILGLPMYTDLTNVPGPVDLACIVVPAPRVFDAVKRCGEKGVKFITVITSGFSEVGNLEEEKKIVAYAKENGMRIIGPNVFGIYSAKAPVNATFGPDNIRPGNVAIVTQSGALGLAMIGKTAVENIGLSAIVSVGNKADVDEADILEYLVEQDETEIILIYIEGIHDGERLVKTLQKATRVKPIIAIKSGRSKRGAAAAASHTGSLAGSDKVFDSVMRQCGVIRAESVHEAFQWCKFLSKNPLPKGENVAIITNGGGVGVMATDACEKYNVELYDNAKDLQQTFRNVTPSFGSMKNPIDITGQAQSEHYYSALQSALENENIHAVQAIYCDTKLFDVDNLGYLLDRNYARYRAKEKPIVFSVFGGKKCDDHVSNLRKNDVPVFGDVYDAISCFGALYQHYRHKNKPVEEPETPEIDAAAIDAVIDSALGQSRHFLLADEAKKVMEAAGITTLKSAVVSTIDDAVSSAASIGYPVVMKIVSKDIIHKSDAGGVALDLENEKEVVDAYQAIMQNAKRYNPNASIEGVEISEMLKPGTEVIVGARRDSSFGPIVMVGLGGIYVEVMRDVAFRALPLPRGDVLEMMKETRAYPLLSGVRGEAQKDIDCVTEMILKLGSIVQKCGRITDIEVNPLMVYKKGDGAKAADVRILLAKEE